MKIKTTKYGIEMKADKEDLIKINKIRRKVSYKSESNFIKKFLQPLGYKQVKPEDFGCLTSAAIIQYKKGDIFGDMNYQILSFIEELAAGITVFWQKGY